MINEFHLAHEVSLVRLASDIYVIVTYYCVLSLFTVLVWIVVLNLQIEYHHRPFVCYFARLSCISVNSSEKLTIVFHLTVWSPSNWTCCIPKQKERCWDSTSSNFTCSICAWLERWWDNQLCEVNAIRGGVDNLSYILLFCVNVNGRVLSILLFLQCMSWIWKRGTQNMCIH